MTGKADWLARGLPIEGRDAARPTAGDVARRDVATCGLRDRVGAVRERVDDSPYRFALVLSKTGVVLGRLRRSALEADPDAIAEDVMEPGPSTVRVDDDLADLVTRLRDRDLNYAIVSTPEGELVGVLRRSDAEARLSQ